MFAIYLYKKNMFTFMIIQCKIEITLVYYACIFKVIK